MKKTIKVHSNDTRRPMSELTVTGEIKRYAEITPQRVMLSGEAGQPVKVTVTIRPASKGLFKVAGAKADGGTDIRVTLTDDKDAEGDAYTLVVENLRETAGQYRDTIRITTTGEAANEILIPVWGNITPPQVITIQPRHVALNGPAGKPIKETVRIAPRKDHALSITDAKAQSGAYIRLDLKETNESGQKIYTLTVENLKKDKGRYYDNIILKTDSKDLPEIRISVTGLITE